MSCKTEPGTIEAKEDDEKLHVCGTGTIETKGDDEKLNVCGTCYETFNSEEQLKKHRLTQHDKELFECKICKQIFYSEDHLKCHNLTLCADSSKEKQKSFVCIICGETFPNDETLHTHVLKHGNIVKNESRSGADDDRSNTCDTCGECFEQKIDLELHMFNLDHCAKDVQSGKLEEKKYKCGYCEKSFKRRDVLRMHEMRHVGDKKFKCNQCDKAFEQVPFSKSR